MGKKALLCLLVGGGGEARWAPLAGGQGREPFCHWPQGEQAGDLPWQGCLEPVTLQLVTWHFSAKPYAQPPVPTPVPRPTPIHSKQ